MANDTQETPDGYAPFDLYPYNPSQPPAFAFLALFGIAAILNLVAMIPYRSFFPLPLVIGCGMEAAGYYFRTQSHDDVRRTLPFIIQNLLVLSAPPFLAASIYMAPRRIARVLESEHITIKPRLVTKLFVVVDVACFATQVAGAIMSGSEDVDQASQGGETIIVGLVLQMIAFGLFVAWTASFHVRMRSTTSRYTSYPGKLHWQRPIHALYVISVLFVVRNITRLVEYNQGGDGEILSNEAYLYALDACVMLAIVVVFLILHPGRLRFKARRYAKKGYSERRIQLERIDSD